MDSPRRRPAYRIAVLQNESEALHNPALELGTSLDEIGDWRVEFFSQRTADAFLRYQRDFDCVVLSYNAAFRTPLVAMLAELPLLIGVLVLHQISVDAPIRLPGELAYTPKLLDAPAAGATVAKGRALGREALLNWPNRVLDDAKRIEAVAECSIEPVEGSPWRPVLEVGDAPASMVLARAPASSPLPVAACSLLLDVRREAHSKLAENLLTYCAAGMPQAAIVSADEPARGRLVRKLRLRGVHAVEVDAAETLDFGTWPLRGVTDVVLDETQATLPHDEHETAWRQRGGRLVRINDKGISILVSERDARWVARRWGEWLQAHPEAVERTETSLIAARAYLRALVRTAQLADTEPGQLGLREPEMHRDRMLELVRTRLKGRDHVDSTISTTIAALDVIRFTGAELDADTTDRIKAWLRARVVVEDASAEDALNVARALEVGEIIDWARTKLLPNTISAGTLTAYEQACVACGRTVEPLAISDASCDLAVREVTTSVLAAAEHVGARAEARTKGMRTDLESPAEARILDAALGTLARRNTLVRGVDLPGDRVEEVCNEAWVFAAFLSLDDVPVGSLVPPESYTPGLIEDALRHGAELREENRTLEHDRDRLELARHLLGAVAVALALGSIVVLQWIESDIFTDHLAIALPTPPLVFVLLGLGLAWIELAPGWLVDAGELVASGVKGVRERIKAQLQRRRAEGSE